MISYVLGWFFIYILFAAALNVHEDDPLLQVYSSTQEKLDAVTAQLLKEQKKVHICRFCTNRFETLFLIQNAGLRLADPRFRYIGSSLEQGFVVIILNFFLDIPNKKINS